MSAEPLAVSTLGLGFVLGIRHALDADHLAAISTLLAEGRSWRRAAIVGTIWGIGHSVALLAAAALIVGFGLHFPPSVATALEVAVGVLIVGLGVRLVWRAAKGRVHTHAHQHGGVLHAHPHTHEGEAKHHHPIPKASFGVGLVHGLAGSAALMLVVLSTIQSTWSAVAYVVIFGAGSTMGMAAMSSAMTLPLAALRRESRRLQIAVGSLSAMFGVYYVASSL